MKDRENEPSVFMFAAIPLYFQNNCGSIEVKFVEASLVEVLRFPVGVGEEPVEARLIGGLGELPVDAEHGFSLGDHQPREVLGKVPPLAFVGEEVAVLGQGVLNDLGKFNDSWHEQMLRTPFAPDENWPKSTPSSLFLQS